MDYQEAYRGKTVLVTGGPRGYRQQPDPGPGGVGGEINPGAGRPVLCLLASVERAKKPHRPTPHTPFDEGLKHTIAWFQDHLDLIAAAAQFGPGMSSGVRNLVSGG